MLSDGIIFYDGKTKMIFNHSSFCEYIKWHIVKFANKNYQQADTIVCNSFLNKQPETKAELYELLNQSAYELAIFVTYGKDYVLLQPCSEEEYDLWSDNIIAKYHIKPRIEIFSQ